MVDTGHLLCINVIGMSLQWTSGETEGIGQLQKHGTVSLFKYSRTRYRVWVQDNTYSLLTSYTVK